MILECIEINQARLQCKSSIIRMINYIWTFQTNVWKLFMQLIDITFFYHHLYNDLQCNETKSWWFWEFVICIRIMNYDIEHARAFGLVVCFSLWVREALSLIIGMPLLFFIFCCNSILMYRGVLFRKKFLAVCFLGKKSMDIIKTWIVCLLFKSYLV